MSKITILHLSDVHFKTKEKESTPTFRQDVTTKMIDTIQQHLDKHHVVPEVVAVTGDIAFSGKEYEYDDAKIFFKDLKAVLPSKTEFLAVPGNHDVDRDRVGPCFPLYETIIEKELIDLFLNNEKHIQDFIDVKFKNFRAFIDEVIPGLYASKNDYFWVKDFKDNKVSFLGLNSCWASGKDNEAARIALGYPQVMKALALSKQENKIILMHHPLFDWLEERDTCKCRGEIFNRCALVLHGHRHVDDQLVLKSPSGPCICLGANASYTKDKNGFIGFQLIEVEFHHGGVEVTVWPYRMDPRTRVKFVPDTHLRDDREGKPFFVLKTYEDDKAGIETPIPLEIPIEYKNWVREFHSTMDIDLLAKKGEVITISLPEVYIPIETRNPFYKEKIGKEDIVIEGFIRHGAVVDLERTTKTDEPAAIDIEILMGRKKRILLRGEAGMGKTTLIKHLAYCITNGICPSSLRGYLPVMVFLKDLWLIYNEEIQNTKKKLIFEDLLILYLERSRCKLTWETVSHFLSHQRALFLVDGLDEVPGHLRTELVEILAQFIFENKENRFLITGRPHGAAGAAAARFGEDLFDIEPLNEQKIEDFIKKWFCAVSARARGLGEVTAGSMISDISQHEHVPVFTRNPLLLTAVCILYQDGKRIPEQRADLYNRVIVNLISRRFHDPTHPEKEDEVLEFLMALAFDNQNQNRKTIETGEALRILETIYPQQKEKEEPANHYKRRILRMFDEIEPACGLFNHVSSGEIEFTHLTFQEFLAAKYMLYMDIDWQHLVEKEWWEESLLLYMGLINIDRKKTSNDIVKTILTSKLETAENEDIRTHLRLLAARALWDFQPTRREGAVVDLSRQQLIRLVESNAALEKRFNAGILLGNLGDTRISDDKMVPVPVGEFIRGSKEYKYAKPVKRIYLDDFMIGVYPVTNQEFKLFIDDNGYHREESWTSEGWQWRQEKNITEPGYWYDRKWNGPNFPVVGISWYEAAAYANWLSKMKGKPYRLPTEAEWEKAARGTDGKIYPWGNTFDKNCCDSRESGLGRTSPVGIFPNGKSDYGCHDMAGNVWEWCADWFDEKYYHKSPMKNPTGPATGSPRVFRGGGWISGALNCACANRRAALPGDRDDYLGFRLARSF